MNLKNLISSVYSTVKQNRTDIFAEYDKTPVINHEGIYAVTGIEKISLESQFMKDSIKRYEMSVDLTVKILGLPSQDPLDLYAFLDSNILDVLAKSGYYLVSAEIGAPVQDHGLNRLVLEGKFLLKAGSEA
ncbi:hypothetical protein [Porcipelethomonas sp.]|uniref:hypothetical protein n=1 Tax=Porcipelethomonas sp. TaxID=2981675 RepID=UPI003EF51310